MTYQWHIFVASLDPTQGSEQADRRPVLVISKERINQILPVVNVLPLTSLKFAQRPIYPNEVFFLLEEVEDCMRLPFIAIRVWVCSANNYARYGLECESL